MTINKQKRAILIAAAVTAAIVFAVAQQTDTNLRGLLAANWLNAWVKNYTDSSSENIQPLISQQSVATQQGALTQQQGVATCPSALNLSFAGYTNPHTGNLGGAKGANEKCDIKYDGSHWCSVDELMRLGDKYSWTYDVWVRDAIRGGSLSVNNDSPPAMITVYGGAGATYTAALPLLSTCAGWSNAGDAYFGPILNAEQGRLDVASCSVHRRLACCR